MRKYVILTIFIVFTIANMSGYVTYKKINKPENQKTERIEMVDNEKQEEVYIQEEIINYNIEPIDIEEKQEEILENNNEVKQEIKQESSAIISAENNKSAENYAEKKIKNEENICNTSTVIVETPKQTEEAKPKEEIIPEKEIKIVEPVVPKEEWKINQSKINEMINVINNNKSDDMINYGYEIVTDSSIVNMTTEFTYTEKRVKDKIKYKFGTIKVYARDYYLDGVLQYTECYII